MEIGRLLIRILCEWWLGNKPLSFIWIMSLSCARMFDADRNGSINFDEFWLVSLVFMWTLLNPIIVDCGVFYQHGETYSTASTPIVVVISHYRSSKRPLLALDIACLRTLCGCCSRRTTAEEKMQWASISSYKLVSAWSEWPMSSRNMMKIVMVTLP